MATLDIANFGIEVTSPISLDATARSGNDAIFEELVADGYTEGTINDREYVRLLDLTGVSPVGHSINDLYSLAGERPRL